MAWMLDADYAICRINKNGTVELTNVNDPMETKLAQLHVNLNDAIVRVGPPVLAATEVADEPELRLRRS